MKNFYKYTHIHTNIARHKTVESNEMNDERCMGEEAAIEKKEENNQLRKMYLDETARMNWIGRFAGLVEQDRRVTTRGGCSLGLAHLEGKRTTKIYFEPRTFGEDIDHERVGVRTDLERGHGDGHGELLNKNFDAVLGDLLQALLLGIADGGKVTLR